MQLPQELNNMEKIHRVRIHQKIRKNLKGTNQRPRLSIFRSSKRIYAQIIDDKEGKTLIFAGDYNQTGTKLQKAYNVGKNLAVKAAKIKIKTVVFDRGGFLYQGRVAQLAKGAREGGLKF